MRHTSSLQINERYVRSLFGLLGCDENALTFALGYTLHQSPTLLQWLLKHIPILGISRRTLKKAQISLQQYQSGEVNAGITDIEIRVPDRFHLTIEAKLGMSVPSIEQLSKYMDRLDQADEKNKKLVTLVQTHDDSYVKMLQESDRRLKANLRALRWADFFSICVEILTSNFVDPQEKAWVHAFYSFLDEEYAMQAFSTEVWILPVETTIPLWPGGLTYWQIHQKYRIYWDRIHRTVRPIYIAFRADGKVESIHRVNKIEHESRLIDVIPELKDVKGDLPHMPWTIWHFDPPVSLPKPIQTGKGMYSRRVRSHLDLLLSCKTVLEIEQAMAKRRQKEP